LEALGLQIGDPIIGLIITLVILRIIWQSFITVQRDLLRVDQPLDRTRSCWRRGPAQTRVRRRLACDLPPPRPTTRGRP